MILRRNKEGKKASLKLYYSLLNNKNKKGQITIFIILSILIISIVFVFFLYVKPNYFSETSSGPKFDNCVKDVVEKEVKDLSGKAGFSMPEFTYKFNGQDFTYLCYTNEYYKTCTVQQPFIKQYFENEVEKRVREKIDLCYQNSLDELKSQGYGVTFGTIKYEVLFEIGQIRVEIDAPTTVGSQSFKKFNIIIPNPIYDIIMIATSIIKDEATYGDSDATQIMFYYQDYVIDKLKQGEGTTLYIIKNKLFDYEFRFASRSLAWPAGYLK